MTLTVQTLTDGNLKLRRTMNFDLHVGSSTNKNMLKVNNKHTRGTCISCSKLTQSSDTL